MPAYRDGEARTAPPTLRTVLLWAGVWIILFGVTAAASIGAAAWVGGGMIAACALLWLTPDEPKGGRR